MVLMVFLLYLSTSKGQNEKVRTDDFMNFLNPIDSQEKIQSQNIEHFIQQYLNFNDDILQESDNHADIQAQEQNNMDSDLFCEIPCDSSLMNIENIQSTSLFDPTSDHKPLYDEIESFLDSISFEIPNPTIGASVSSIEPECQCVGLCLCITPPNPDNTTLDVDSSCYIDSNIFLSEILFSNEQNQQDDIKNIDISQSEPSQINSEVEKKYNSKEQSQKQQIYQDTTENFLSPVQSNIITSLSHNRYNPKHNVQIKKLYLDHENKMTEASGVKTKLKAKKVENQHTVKPLTSQEIVRPGVKYAKKRKNLEESNQIAKRKTENVASMIEKSFPCFYSGGNQTCFNISENELLVDQAKTIYDPESQDTLKEFEDHLKNCDFHAHPLLKKLIIKIDYENSEVKSVKYIRMGSNRNIEKTEKSNQTLHIFGTFITYPSEGGSSFTVRVPKKFEDEDQFENSDNPLASAFVSMTNVDTYNLTLIMSCYNKKMKLPSASYILDNEDVYVPCSFHAYHFKQVIRFKLIRRMQGGVFYYFEYRPEKIVLRH